MGSGHYLKRSIQKNGIENFEKTILWVFDAPEPMYELEAWLVNEDYLAEGNTYNLKLGGMGGWDRANRPQHMTEKRLAALKLGKHTANQAKARLFETDQCFRDSQLTQLASMRDTAFRNNPKGTFYGKTHTQETKQKMSDAAKRRVTNPSTGTFWITDGVTSRKLRADDIIPPNWKLGRTIQKKDHVICA